MAKISEIPAGIRLHLQYFYYKFNDKNLKKNYFLSFEDIPNGLKAEKILKEFKIPFRSIPVPDDIFESCGVAIIVKEFENIVKILEQNSIKVEVFKYEDNLPKKIYGNIEKNGCEI